MSASQQYSHTDHNSTVSCTTGHCTQTASDRRRWEYLLFLLLRPHIAAYVGPRHVLGPPNGSTLGLAPAGLAATRRVLEHLGDEGTQLSLHNTQTRSAETTAHSVATFCLSSSMRTSLRTFAHGMSSGHQIGRHSSLPQPGLPRPVEYFSISGMNVRSCACKEASHFTFRHSPVACTAVYAVWTVVHAAWTLVHGSGTLVQTVWTHGQAAWTHVQGTLTLVHTSWTGLWSKLDEPHSTLHGNRFKPP